VTIFSLYLQNSIGSTITLSGEVIALRVLTYVVGIIIAFLLVSQRIVDVRILLIVAAVSSAIALYGFARSMTPTAEAATFVGVSLAFGLVFGMLSQPVPSLVIGTLPLPDLPAGIAIYKLTAPIGLMAGTAFVSWFVDHRAAFHASDIAPALNLSRAPLASFVSADRTTLAKLSALVTQQAQDLAYRDAMLLLAVVLLLMIPLILLVVPPAPRPTE
jgi:DHA2 family multidrug resistance protein